MAIKHEKVSTISCECVTPFKLGHDPEDSGEWFKCRNSMQHRTDYAHGAHSGYHREMAEMAFSAVGWILKPYCKCPDCVVNEHSRPEPAES